MSFITKTERVEEIQKFDFDEFQRKLGGLRKIAETILGKIEPTSLATTKENNYKSCLANLKERMDLLDKYAENLYKRKKQLEIESKEPENDEQKIQVMQARSKLKNVQIFLDTIEAERKREEFYRKKAIEKYMEVFLEIEQVKDTHNG